MTHSSLRIVSDRLRSLSLQAAAMALLLGGLALVPEPAVAARVVAAPDNDPASARVIVKLKASGALLRQAQAMRSRPGALALAAAFGARSGLALADGRVIAERMQVLRARGLSSAQLAARLAADADVEYAVPDQRRRALALPNDPLFAGGPAVSPTAGQWYLRAPDATRVSGMDVVGAWAVGTGSRDVIVAVLDTGVRPEHPDLANVLTPGYDFIADAGEAGDGNGRDADASDPGDWIAEGECAVGEPAADSSWHGTKMAGLIGAQTDNGIGMAAVGWGVRVQPVRVLGPCGGYDSDILAAALWAAGLSSSPVVNRTPAQVINLSLGSSGTCTAAYRDVFSRLEAAGVAVVAAAGNEEGLAVGTPGNCPGVIAVAGLRHAGTKVGFSSIGPEVTIAAPGGNCVNLIGDCLYPILTTTNTGTRGPAASAYTDARDYSVGTSFSSPLVAGTLALMLSVNPQLTPAQMRAFLRATARPFVAGDPGVPQCRAPSQAVQDECACTTSTCGAGMLDAGAAVRAAAAAKGDPGGASGGSSGGGALELPTLLALLLAVLAGPGKGVRSMRRIARLPSSR